MLIVMGDIFQSIQLDVQILESNFGNLSINPQTVNDFIGIQIGHEISSN